MAREHFTVEQALYLFNLLANGWNTDAQLTSIVKYREICIIFALNPDGGEYDLTGPAGPRGPYRAWRKNWDWKAKPSPRFLRSPATR